MNEDFSNMDFDPSALPLDMQQVEMGYYSDVAATADLGLMMAFMGMAWIFALVFYVYSAICFMAIAKRTNTPNGWFAFIPVLNIILMLQIAKRPLWWILLMFIPFVNIVISVIVFIDILKALNRPGWWVILNFVPIVNLVILGIMAWGGNSAKPAAPTPPAAPQAPTPTA